MLERVWEREPSFSVGGNVNWYSHIWKFLEKKNLKILLAYDPTIPLPVQMLNPYVYRCTIHSRQDTETSYMSIDR